MSVTSDNSLLDMRERAMEFASLIPFETRDELIANSETIFQWLLSYSDPTPDDGLLPVYSPYFVLRILAERHQNSQKILSFFDELDKKYSVDFTVEKSVNLRYDTLRKRPQNMSEREATYWLKKRLFLAMREIGASDNERQVLENMFFTANESTGQRDVMWMAATVGCLA